MTLSRIIRLRASSDGKEANPHRATEIATAGGRTIYNNLRRSLFVNQEASSKAFHKVIQEFMVEG